MENQSQTVEKSRKQKQFQWTGKRALEYCLFIKYDIITILPIRFLENKQIEIQIPDFEQNRSDSLRIAQNYP